MLQGLARASRRVLPRRGASPSPLLQLPRPLLFPHAEDSRPPPEPGHPRHFKTRDPLSLQFRRSRWVGCGGGWLLRQGHVELGDGFRRSLLFPAPISGSAGAAEERGERKEGGSGDRRHAAGTAPASWVERYLPRSLRPYALLARLDKPIGTWLLAWPCMWSIAIAATPGNLPDLKMMTLFGCGAVLLRGAGCTVNDLLDRDIDNKVERTKSRPIASGLLTPFQGLSFLGFQLLLGLCILLQLNNFRCIIIAAGFLLSPDEEIYILASSIFRLNL